jgi:hypothetical protein
MGSMVSPLPKGTFATVCDHSGPVEVLLFFRTMAATCIGKSSLTFQCCVHGSGGGGHYPNPFGRREVHNNSRSVPGSGSISWAQGRHMHQAAQSRAHVWHQGRSCGGRLQSGVRPTLHVPWHSTSLSPSLLVPNLTFLFTNYELQGLLLLLHTSRRRWNKGSAYNI